MTKEELQSKKIEAENDLRKLEGEVYYLLQNISEIRQRLETVQTEEDAEEFDAYLNSVFGKLEIIDL